MTDKNTNRIEVEEFDQGEEWNDYVDVTKEAMEIGFFHQVAISEEIWSRYVSLSPSLRGRGISAASRLEDILVMLKVYSRFRKTDEHDFLFDVIVRDNYSALSKATFKASVRHTEGAKVSYSVVLPSEIEAC